MQSSSPGRSRPQCESLRVGDSIAIQRDSSGYATSNDHMPAPLSAVPESSWQRSKSQEPQPSGTIHSLEAFACLVTAAVFKAVEAFEKMLSGFDSHPLPFLTSAAIALIWHANSEYVTIESSLLACPHLLAELYVHLAKSLASRGDLAASDSTCGKSGAKLWNASTRSVADSTRGQGW